MKKEGNPILEPENYYDGYQQKIDELKQKPEAMEFDKLCYYALELSEDGKKLIQFVTDRYLIPGFANPNIVNAGENALYYEGFKEAFRMLRNSIKSHLQRIEAENIPS